MGPPGTATRTRMLHFGSSQMALECCAHGSAACEEYPAGVHFSEASGSVVNIKAVVADLKVPTAMWTTIIQNYSKMALTVADDMLLLHLGSPNTS